MTAKLENPILRRWHDSTLGCAQGSASGARRPCKPFPASCKPLKCVLRNERVSPGIAFFKGTGFISRSHQ